MKRTGIWATATVISAIAHGGALLALTLATTPDPVEDQPTPKSKLNIESQQVDRTTVTEQEAPSQDATEGTTSATKVGQGLIRQSKATATNIPTQKTAASTPTTKPISAITTATTALKPAAPKTPATKATSAALTTTSATALPTQQTTAIAANTSATNAPETPAIANEAPTLELPAEQGTASLAWSGDGTMDPVSLAAIQAFMQPGDATQNTDTVRDGISAVLAAVPCARLQTTFIPETGELQLRGHIPDTDMRGPILAALKEQVGSAIPVSDELLILPRPQCGALSGIANVGLPQSTDQLTNPRVVGPSGFARNYTYSNGQRLTLDMTAPDYDSYLYVDYFTADGNVLHLQPNTIVPIEFATAQSEQTVGKPRGGKPFLELTIAPPFGQEIAAAFASSVPLYQDLRPIQEPTGPYLEFLKERVAAARAEHSDFKGEWVYFFISTQEE